MNNSLRIIIGAAAAAVLIIAGGVAFVLTRENSNDTSTAASETTTQVAAPQTPRTFTRGEQIVPPPQKDIVFSNVEQFAGEITPLLPQGANVGTDPQGKRNEVTINFPLSVPDAQAKEALDKIQPLAERAYQYRGVQTQIGRRTSENVVLGAQPFAPFSPTMKMSEQFDAINAMGPHVNGFFDLVMLTPEGINARTMNQLDKKDCIARIRETNKSFKAENLGVGNMPMSIRHNCGGNPIAVHGEIGKFELKLDSLANVLEKATLLPQKSVVVVEKGDALVIETPGEPPAGLEAQVSREWQLGRVDVYKAKSN